MYKNYNQRKLISLMLQSAAIEFASPYYIAISYVVEGRQILLPHSVREKFL